MGTAARMALSLLLITGVTVLHGALPHALDETRFLLYLPAALSASLGGKTWPGVAMALVAAVAAVIFPPPVTQPVAIAIFMVGSAFGSWAVSRAVRRLRQEIRDREDLAALIAHDVRSPLAAVLLSCTQLARGAEAKDLRLLKQAERALQRAVRLVNNLLSFTTLQQGRIRLAKRPTDLDALINVLLPELRLLAEASSVDVAFVPGSPPVLPLDPALMESVIVNLAVNAIQHSPPRGTVSIRTTASGTAVYLTVDDEGPGVGDETERLFARGETRRAGGVGLGLYLVREIVRAHRGEVTLARREGGGARALVKLLASPTTF